ncbi:MAG: excinuclease ABC subunit UvrB [Deltaproteobacteria bacterium]|nr:excinuclease ABC subunit UvrB [Deltaproteobacteria bacterium]
MGNGKFRLISEFKPKGDQPKAIEALTEGILKGTKHQTLLGVTGSGKTFTMAHTIANLNKPALIIAPNKTLAAQLFSEFRELFPENAVEYFVSYYDYYQPEAYVPHQDLYIEKDSSINEEIDKLRHASTRSILERHDTIIVASVSCIYGLGSPEAYHGLVVPIESGKEYPRQQLLKDLIKVQYERNDYDFHRATFRVRGDVVEIFPAHEEERAIRVEFFGDEIERLTEIDALRGQILKELESITIYPASHYVTPEEQIKRAIQNIRDELKERLEWFKNQGKLVEAQRLEQRTNFDLEMMEEMGFCKGIENYSRHITGRGAGQPPPTLIDYFPRDFLLFVDESHITIPQLNGMYNGDKSRKANLVDYGFRLPSALDNRPLKFEEFGELIHQIIYVSATPSDYEIKTSKGVIIEQLIRPTGLIDPKPVVRPAEGQVSDLEKEIRLRAKEGERVLVTTLTKKMSEDLTRYYQEKGIRVKYLHSDIETLERVELLRSLRLGEFDVLIGINLLREGLDLPEVSLVAILDADKEGFLRSARSLIQTFGRAARNLKGEAILYADRMTDSMQKAIEETLRRRKLQTDYNKKHGITPQSVKKNISDALHSIYEKDYFTVPAETTKGGERIPIEKIPEIIEDLKKQMKKFATNMEFEKAAEIRDRIKLLREKELTLGIRA